MDSKPILLLAVAALGGSASAVTATFDSFAEGSPSLTVVDGGITFSNLDRRQPGITNYFTIDDAHGDLTGVVGFSSNNVLGFGGYSPGEHTAFATMGSFDFSAGFLAGSASMTVFPFGNDPGMTLTLQGLRGGSVVGSSTLAVNPYYDLVGQSLSLSGGAYDSFRVLSNGPVNSGATFMVVDNVTVNAAPVPEPTTFAALGLGTLGLLRRRRRFRRTADAPYR